MPEPTATDGQTSSATRALHTVTLLCVVALAFAVRIYRIDEQSVWTDDFFSIGYLGAPDLDTYLGLVSSSNEEHVPVYYASQYMWAEFFGSAPVTVRMLSIVVGLLTIPVIYALGCALFSPGAGLVAVLFFALSPMHIFHDQGMRPYALVVLLAAVSLYALHRTVTAPRPGWWLVHCAANLLLVWTHLFALFFIAAEALCVLCAFARERRPLVLWAGAHAVLLAPTLVHILVMPRMAAETYTGYFNAPGWREVLFDLVGEDAIELNGELLTTQNTWAMLGDRAGDFLFELHPVYDTFMVFFFCACVVWAIWRGVAARRDGDRAVARGIGLLLAVLVLPVLTLAVLSHVWRPCIFPRYTLYGSVALYVLAGGALTRIPNRGLRTAVLLLMLGTYAYQLSFLLPANVRTDWLGVAEQVAERGEDGDLVLVGAQPGPAMGAYHFALFNGVGTDGMHIVPAHTRQALLGKSVRYAWAHPENSVWAVVQHDYGLTRPAEFEAALLQGGLQFEHRAFFGMENLSLYHIRAGQPKGQAPPPPQLRTDVDYEALLSRLGFPAEDDRRIDALEKLRWVRENPVPDDNPWHVALIARLLVDEGDPRLTLAAAEKALAMNPNWLIARLAHAVALLQLDEMEAADAAFEEFQALNPTYGRVLAPLLQALFVSPDRERARREAARLQQMLALRLPQALFEACGAAGNRYYVFD